MRLRSLLLVLLLACQLVGFAQDTLIRLHNPSFEGVPGQGVLPFGWTNCGLPDESPPDTGPHDAFMSSTFPSEGKTHLIMVTRSAGSVESVSTRLSDALQPGQCYAFSLDIASTATYMSIDQLTGLAANYNAPVILRIWGSDSCYKRELLAVTPSIYMSSWKHYEFTFQPAKEHGYLLLEVFFATPIKEPTNGNIMLDNIQPIRKITPCERDSMSALARGHEVEREIATAKRKERSSMLTQEERAKKYNIPFLKIRTLEDTLTMVTAVQQINAGQYDEGLTSLASGIERLSFLRKPILYVLINDDERARTLVKTLRDKAAQMKIYREVKIKRLGVHQLPVQWFAPPPEGGGVGVVY